MYDHELHNSYLAVIDHLRSRANEEGRKQKY